MLGNNPAFPFVSSGGVHEHQYCEGGMTVRQYAAIHICADMCADPSRGGEPKEFVKYALEIADALLREEHNTAAYDD